ncbi:hypothetical protein [Nocardioides marmoraquaticus]
MRLRRAPAALVVLGVVALFGPTGWADPAVAGCAAPTLRVDSSSWDRTTRPQLAAGSPVVVEGRSLRDSCNDTGTTTVSPLGCEEQVVDPPGPASDVALRVEQGDRSWVLGRTDADASYDATWRVRLPTELRPGPARLVADGSEPLRVRVIAGR